MKEQSGDMVGRNANAGDRETVRLIRRSKIPPVGFSWMAINSSGNKNVGLTYSCVMYSIIRAGGERHITDLREKWWTGGHRSRRKVLDWGVSRAWTALLYDTASNVMGAVLSNTDAVALKLFDFDERRHKTVSSFGKAVIRIPVIQLEEKRISVQPVCNCPNR
ncbi:hypothetical protein J6590_026652 [Homalodisca vitripennis]|nr:hypothetical protein J6590_026652 [Homalodisca vitripennis]